MPLYIARGRSPEYSCMATGRRQAPINPIAESLPVGRPPAPPSFHCPPLQGHTWCVHHEGATQGGLLNLGYCRPWAVEMLRCTFLCLDMESVL